MSEDEEEQGGSEEEEEDESIMEDEDSIVNKSSYEPTEDGDDDDDEEGTDYQRGSSSGHSPTPSPPRIQRGKPTGTPLAVKTNLIPSTDREPWAQTLKLEPNRVAVMQASFFGQGASASKQKEVENQRELERERRRKEAAISASNASRRDEKIINTEDIAVSLTQKWESRYIRKLTFGVVFVVLLLSVTRKYCSSVSRPTTLQRVQEILSYRFIKLLHLWQGREHRRLRFDARKVVPDWMWS